MGEHAESWSGSGFGRTVSDVLAELQSEHGISLLHGVLLGKETPGGHEVEHLDHVVVDPNGILIVEVMTPRRAVISGRYTDRTWSARFPEGRTEVLPNPIRENDHRVGLLYEALTRAGWGLSLDHVRGIAVFVDCDVAQLELDSVNASRVCEVRELAERYETRRGFAASQPIPPDQVAKLAHAVAQLDRSSDAAIASPGPVQADSSGSPLDDLADEVPEASTARRRVDPERRREVMLLVGGLLALLVVAVGALGILRSLPRDEPAGGGFVPQQTQVPAPVPGTSVGPTVEESAETRVEPDIALAKKRLQQVFPERYDQITDADDPEIADQVEGQITYRWEYVAQSASNAISVGTVSITLDGAGAVIGSSD